MVILLNRPMPSTATIHVGERRTSFWPNIHGPTKTVTVAHQLHLSRFTNMARWRFVDVGLNLMSNSHSKCPSNVN